MKALIDLDFVKYAIASIGESRTILVTHKPSGRVKEFNTRTEFYGHHSKKAGGWLSEVNAERITKDLVPFTVDEFEITDKQEVKEPLANVLHSAKLMVDEAIKVSGATNHEAFIGKGESFRTSLSTLLEYKGTRREILKPLLLDDVTEYLTKKYSANVVTDIEVDDAVVIESYNKPENFILGVDKDYYGAGSKFFNVNRPDEGVVDCTGFGKLWLDDTSKVRGVGRMFKYFQVLSEDTSDNYCANCFSDTKWGAKSAYKALKDCADDEAAFRSLVSCFQGLYPEGKTVIGWRGEPVPIDWLYVMQECFDMAHLQRWKGDRLNIRSILTTMKVI